MKSPHPFPGSRMTRAEVPCRQRRLLGLLAVAWIFATPGPACAREGEANLAWNTRVVGEAHVLRGDSPFAAGLALTSLGRDRYRIEQELRGRLGPVSVLLTATESGQEAARPKAKFLANEAYADFTLGGERYSLGKKVLSADVAFAFRPIDVLQRENRLQVMPAPLEGVPMLSWDNFSADGAWSLVLANPGRGRRGTASEDGSLALRIYRRVGATDVHGVLRHSSRHGIELGVAASAVPNDALEVHASFLTQQRGERRLPLADGASIQNLLSADASLATERVDSPRKVLLGATWTTAGGISLLGELWWDGTAPAAADWRRLARQAAQRSALVGLSGVPTEAVAAASAAATRVFAQGNLAQRGMLARLAWIDPGGNWSVSADMLRSLDDGGQALTAAITWQGDHLRFDAGLRRQGGPADSAHGLLPERDVVFLGLSAAY